MFGSTHLQMKQKVAKKEMHRVPKLAKEAVRCQSRSGHPELLEGVGYQPNLHEHIVVENIVKYCYRDTNQP
jgi:hypothetical protein